MSGGEELVEKLLGMTNTFCKWDKFILLSGQIHFAIWTNKISNWEWVQMSGGEELVEKLLGMSNTYCN